MSDYISREAAVTIADYAADEYPYDKDPQKPATYSEYNQGWNDACDYIRGRLERKKPANVEPVRHVAPIYCWIDEYYGGWLQCPNCGFDSNTNIAKFCGGCGAKMILEDENNDD